MNCLEVLAAFHAVKCFCQRQEKHYSAVEIGQHISRIIREHTRRDSVPQAEQHCQRPVATV